jgi:hypothetical protein
LSHLIELKRYWDPGARDLTKLALALYYLQANANRGTTGVQLTSVFFGAFLFHRPETKYPGEERHKQEVKIKTDLKSWWENVKAYPGVSGSGLIRESPIRKWDPEFRWVPKRDWWAGAVCVCLSIDRPAQAAVA